MSRKLFGTDGVRGVANTDPMTVETALAAMRADLLEVLRTPSDGSPIAGRRWPPRYAARRMAWHVLDHAHIHSTHREIFRNFTLDRPAFCTMWHIIKVILPTT